ncbi:MAG: branched-chain amino acid ABC transporter permease [Actinomycetales bacterium]|nr:branched-chain amino acid ABC transporter permease [Actinomycetales bacterium]
MNVPALARGGVLTVALLALPLLGLEHWVLNLLIFTLMYAAMSSAWNLVGGFAGYPSLGHAAFFGFGAYFIGLWFQHHDVVSGYEPFVILPLVGLLAALVGAPIGWIAMRTRADVFAIVTITLLFVAQTLAFNLDDLTGGAQGLAMPTPPFELARFEWPFYYAMLWILLLSMALTYLSMRSKVGLSLDTVRADEDKALGIGIHVQGVKVLSFSVSVGLVAMAGGVWAYYETFVYPQFAFDPLITIGMVLMVFLGGRATLWGPILGAVILVPGQQYLAYKLGGSQLYLIAYAAVFLLIMLLMPRGILPTVADRLRRRRAVGTSSDAGPPTAAPPSAGAGSSVPVPSGGTA